MYCTSKYHNLLFRWVLQSYYYAISDFVVGGKCLCNGHADNCDKTSPSTGNPVCDCKHNTTGDDCDKCLPLFNNKFRFNISFQTIYPNLSEEILDKTIFDNRSQLLSGKNYCSWAIKYVYSGKFGFFLDKICIVLKNTDNIAGMKIKTF